MEVLVNVILAQLLKAANKKKMAQPGSYGFIAARKFHHLIGPMHLRVLASAKKPRDVDIEAGGQGAIARVED